VLSHYCPVGVQGLDQEKSTPLLRLKYGAIQDAILCQPEQIGSTFAGFRKDLYAKAAA
jgi:type I restriction enzyme R subunit